jgi:GTPase SAR1 family protein
MKKIILIVGDQGTGKTTLANSFKGAKVLEMLEDHTYSKEEIIAKNDFVVLTYPGTNIFLKKNIEKMAEEKSAKFFYWNLNK